MVPVVLPYRPPASTVAPLNVLLADRLGVLVWPSVSVRLPVASATCPVRLLPTTKVRFVILCGRVKRSRAAVAVPRLVTEAAEPAAPVTRLVTATVALIPLVPFTPELPFVPFAPLTPFVPFNPTLP